jgi:hypothetical protein
MRHGFQACAIVAFVAGALCGCGYREVKAPCSPDEGQPSMLTSYAPVARQRTPFDGLAVGETASDPCGPMRKINETLR